MFIVSNSMTDTPETEQKRTMGASSGPNNFSLNMHKAGMEGVYFDLESRYG